MLEPVHGPESAPSNLPWEAWELDEDFFKALSHWTLSHPDTSLDRIFKRISAGIDANRDLFAMIPDQPFPARSLVTAVAHLFTLGVVGYSLLVNIAKTHINLSISLGRVARGSRSSGVCEKHPTLGYQREIGV